MASVFEVMAKLTANTQNFDAGMEKASQSVEKISESAEKTSGKAGKAFSILGKTTLGVFAAAAAAVGGVLAKGVTRLSGIEEAQAKLTGLGNSTETVAGVMEDALSAVRGTAFGMAEAATIAASAVAAGVQPGAELSGFLKTVADTAYIAGTSLEDMGAILNQTVTTGVATNDTLMQLAGRGIPIYHMLSEELGVTTEAISEMARNGDISAGILQSALNEKIGGAALKSGETVQGAFANMNAAFQRVGANIAGPVYNQFQGFFSDVITAMGPLEARAKEMGVEIGEALEPIMDSMIDVFMPLIELVFDLITPLLKLVDAFKPLFDIVKPVAELLGEMVKAVLPPLVKIIAVAAKVFADLISAALPLIEQIFFPLVNVLEKMVVPIIELLGRYISEFLIPIFSYLAGEILSTVMPVINGLAQVFEDYILPVITGFVDFIIQHLPTVLNVFKTVFDGIATAVTWVWENVLSPIFGALFDFLGIDMSGIGKSFKKGFDNAEIKPFEHMALKANITKPAAVTLGTSVGTALGTSLSTAAGAAAAKTDPFKEFIKGLEESIMKVSARIRLQGMGLSEGLVESILGSSDWQAVYSKLINGTEKTINIVKKLYSMSESGIEELKDAVNVAEEAVEDAKDKLAELDKEMEDFVNRSSEFNRKMRDMFKDANPFAALLDKRGEFERQVATTFTNFYNEISSGLKDGLIDDTAAEELSLLTARYEQQLSVIAKRVDQINTELEGLYVIRSAAKAYQEGMRDILEATQPLARVELEIGRFEAQVVSSFDAVNSKIEDGLNIGLFSEQVATQLRATASQTKTTLMTIARQRDMLARTYTELTDNLNASKDFRQATKNAIMGVANITTIGKSARTMIRNLSKTLERTERFRDQLGTLQQLGLNKEAYNQIVNSGLDAGTATAKAILRGGPEAVKEINNLFGKLELEADMLASDAEKFMFNGGEETIQGFIDGIVAQDEELRRTAETEATAFNTTFKNVIDAAELNLNATIAQLEGEKENLVNSATLLANAFAEEFQRIMDATFARLQAQIAAAQAAARAAVAEAEGRAAAARAAAEAAMAAATQKAEKITSTAAKATKTASSTSGKVTTSGVSSTTGKAKTTSVQRVNTNTLAGVLAASGPSFNVTVNAGIGTNGAAVGQQVTKVLTQYARTSGGGGGNIKFL